MAARSRFAFLDAASPTWLNGRLVLCCGVVLAALSFAVLIENAIGHWEHGLATREGGQLGDDFIIFWSAAKLAWTGHAILAYDNERFFAFQQSVVGTAAAFKFCPYPPVAFLLWAPFALLPFVPAWILWVVVGIGLCAGLLSRIVGWPMALVAAVGAPAAFLNLASGQNGYFTASFLAAGLMLVEKRPTAAGVCFGLLCYKPQMGLLLPFALAAGGHWRTIVAAAVTGAVLLCTSVAFFSVETWTAALQQMAHQRHELEIHQNVWLSRLPTVFALLRQAGAPLAMAYAGQALSAIGAAAALVAVWRSRIPQGLKSAASATAIFLATPYAFDYDTIVLLFAAAWLARDGTCRPLTMMERLAALVLLTLPAVMIAVDLTVSEQIAPLLLWSAFAVIVRRSLSASYIPDSLKS